MPDVPFDSGQNQSQSDTLSNANSETVCIDANRIYDSCGAKDCLSDLTLLFTEENQNLVNSACSVRICNATVITATVDVEPVAFHRGFYAIDMVFYFDVSCEIYTSTGTIPTTVNGLAVYGKRVVLYGSEGCTKTFTSDSETVCEELNNSCNSCTYQSNLPRASVQISNPMALSAKLNEHGRCRQIPCGNIPQCVAAHFGGELVQPGPRWISATIGIFTITQLESSVQLMIPSYDFCVPRKECAARTDDPCEVFSKIEFPTDSFFPPTVGECDRESTPFECSCQE